MKGTITNNGVLSLNSTNPEGNPFRAWIFDQTRLNVNGQVTLQGSGVLELGDNVQNRVVGGQLVNAAGHTIRGGGSLGDATFNGGASPGTLALTNYGLIEATTPTRLDISLSSGINAGVMQARNGGTLLLSSGTIDNSGVGSSFAQINTLASNVGSFSILNGRDFTTQAALQNTGNINIGGSGSALNVNGAFTQTGGATTLTNGTLSASLINIQGGILNGNGAIVGNVEVGAGGTVSPGFSPGHIAVNGNFTLDAGGHLLLEVASATSFDHLTISGIGMFFGEIDIFFLDGFTPTTGEFFDFIATGASAQFGNGFSWQVLGLNSDFTFGTDFAGGFTLNTTGTLAPVPEPETYALMLAGLALLGFVARRRKQQFASSKR